MMVTFISQCEKKRFQKQDGCLMRLQIVLVITLGKQ